METKRTLFFKTLSVVSGLLVTSTCVAAQPPAHDDTPAEVSMLISAYSGNEKAIDTKTATPTPAEFRKEKLVQERDNPDSLCNITFNPHFKMPHIHWDGIDFAWSGFTMATSQKTKGLNYSALASSAKKLFTKKMWERIKAGTCKMAQKQSKHINTSINKAYDKAKANAFAQGEATILNSEQAKKYGLDSLDRDGVTGVAALQTKKQLKEYDEYGHWYKKGYGEEETIKSNINGLISSQIDRSKDEVINRYAPYNGDTLLQKANTTLDSELSGVDSKIDDKTGTSTIDDLKAKMNSKWGFGR